VRLPSVALLTLLASASFAQAPAARTFPITLHLLAPDARASVDTRVAVANQIFAPADVAFAVQEVVPLDARHADLVSREDRDALGAYVTPRTIHVFVVRSLMDVDTPPLARRGVHWRDRGRRGVRYVIVIAEAGESVLAHELGHYFGNAHSDVPGNVMSYTRAEGLPFFDAPQIARIRGSARRLARAFRLPR
jgi:hypothetical protein